MSYWHEAIIGVTGSGKTFLAQHKAREYRNNNTGTLVLHKPREPWPRDCVSWQTSDPVRFAAMFWKAKSCACFMELADADVNKYDAEFHKMFSEGRHEGHRCFFLSQYGPQVHPIIRINCTRLSLFSCNDDAAKTWSKEFRDRSLIAAAELPERMFYFKPNRFEPAKLCVLDV